jgi:Arc/MetJ-type ribon-helix-helix transcriptional regulator
VKIPKELVQEMDKLIGKHGFRSRGEITKEALRRFMEHYKNIVELPVLEHFNLNEQGVMILDRSIDPPKGKLVEVYFKPMPDDTLKIFCEYDETDKCRHVDFALDLPEVQEIIRKKGWKIK